MGKGLDFVSRLCYGRREIIKDLKTISLYLSLHEEVMCQV